MLISLAKKISLSSCKNTASPTWYPSTRRWCLGPKKFGINLLATNDVHYVREQDGGPHDVLLCVQTGTTVQTKERMRMSDGSYFLKSRAQMEETFRPYIDLPASAFDNSVHIAEMCEVDLEDESYHLPDLPIPDGYTYESYLRHLTEEGLVRLYGDSYQSEVVQERKERELTDHPPNGL